MLPTTISWTSGPALRILDQTLLPGEERYLDLTTVTEVAEAIRSLRVRGAPLIGISAAMGVALVARRSADRSREGLLGTVLSSCDQLQATRPTAVNLAWALDRMRAVARSHPADLTAALVREADTILEEDRAMCRRIGEVGLPLLASGSTVLTHCNAGALATGGIGTALAPIYLAHEAGRAITVVADETRPLLQGSRLTAWELTRAGVPTTVITDNMAASRLRRGDITCVIVGADRIARNGDVANKIGTYGVALAARAHGVPFYVAAPRSTFDPGTLDGSAIPIEERGAEEVRRPGGAAPTAPSEASVWNPAFDVTPADLIAGYVTDQGLLSSNQLGALG